MHLHSILIFKKSSQLISSHFIYVTVSEAVIGQVDVKTKTVHFNVQRSSTFSTRLAAIPFESVLLNEGGAFELSSRTFTVPVQGIYDFDFSGVKDYTAIYLGVH